MIEIIGCILLITIGIFFICMTVDELRTNYKTQKRLNQPYKNRIYNEEELKEKLEG